MITYNEDCSLVLTNKNGKKAAYFISAVFPDLSPRVLFVSDNPTNKN
jgi:hypothetical protein